MSRRQWEWLATAAWRATTVPRLCQRRCCSLRAPAVCGCVHRTCSPETLPPQGWEVLGGAPALPGSRAGGQALHHLAQAEVYYVIWLEEALPDEPIARYREASRRFEAQVRRVFARPPQEQEVLFSDRYTPTTAEHLAQMVLTAEQALLNG